MDANAMGNRGAEELHNEVVALLASRKARLETALYVLEMIKFELLLEKYKQLFRPANGGSGPGSTEFG